MSISSRGVTEGGQGMRSGTGLGGGGILGMMLHHNTYVQTNTPT